MNASENYILTTPIMEFFIVIPTFPAIIASWNGQSEGKDQIGVDIPRRKNHPKKECEKSIRKRHDTIHG